MSPWESLNKPMAFKLERLSVRHVTRMFCTVETIDTVYISFHSKQFKFTHFNNVVKKQTNKQNKTVKIRYYFGRNERLDKGKWNRSWRTTGVLLFLLGIKGHCPFTYPEKKNSCDHHDSCRCTLDIILSVITMIFF